MISCQVIIYVCILTCFSWREIEQLWTERDTSFYEEDKTPRSVGHYKSYELE